MFDAALIEIREYARFNLPLRYLNIIQEINKDKKKLKLSKTENIFKIKQMVEQIGSQGNLQFSPTNNLMCSFL